MGVVDENALRSLSGGLKSGPKPIMAMPAQACRWHVRKALARRMERERP